MDLYHAQESGYPVDFGMDARFHGYDETECSRSIDENPSKILDLNYCFYFDCSLSWRVWGVAQTLRGVAYHLKQWYEFVSPAY